MEKVQQSVIAVFLQPQCTHKMKSRTEYVQPIFVDQLKKEITMFKEFKKLVDEWVGLAIEFSKLKIASQKKKISQ